MSQLGWKKTVETARGAVPAAGRSIPAKSIIPGSFPAGKLIVFCNPPG